MTDQPRKRHYKPSGKPIDDGKELFHMYGRVQPHVLEYLKLYAEDHQTSDAQTVGDFLTKAVSDCGMGLEPGTDEYDRHITRLKLAYGSQRTKPVRPARKPASQDPQ